MSRCYTPAQICALLQMHPRTFRRLRKDGRLPFLEELRPRVRPNRPLYRADLVDSYLDNQWKPEPARVLLHSHRSGRKSA